VCVNVWIVHAARSTERKVSIITCEDKEEAAGEVTEGSMIVCVLSTARTALGQNRNAVQTHTPSPPTYVDVNSGYCNQVERKHTHWTKVVGFLG
jgi:hypothetical protein